MLYVLVHDEVTAIFDDLDNANNVAKLTGGGLAGPFEVNAFMCEEPPAGKEYWDVAMNKVGDVTFIEQNTVLQEDGTQPNCWYDTGEYVKGWRLDAGLYANSKNHAIEIVDELRRQILAGKRPLTQSSPYVDTD
jgi:hypothetical protein